MKVAFFDCFSGASGDMILGALVHTGADLEELRRKLRRLPLKGFKIETSKKLCHGISATLVRVIIDRKHEHHRTFTDIKDLIEKSNLSETVTTRSITAFEKIARAESKIHRKPLNKIHFHEVGALDAVIDVVGTMLLIEQLGIEKIYCSRMTLGTGEVKCMHGILPVPSPATVEILKRVPVQRINLKAELTTPTGAAILTTLADRFDYFPPLTLLKSGYGAGSHTLPGRPNLLRVMIGQVETPGFKGLKEETVSLISCEIDDMNPEIYGYVSEELFSRGCLDVHLVPIQMKKGRPGITLQVLVSPEKTAETVEFILKETSTFGVKVNETSRFCLKRKRVVLETPYGKLKAKVGMRGSEVLKVVPEYESVKSAAKKSGVSFSCVYNKAIQEIQKRFFT